ncbi:MAG: hypothetical protein D6729_12410 [Deltaproteobacteria bacterium]|nr:MAG: hypothetical protein D6729_12410 [Deltaproteobacteria bacterium]
MGVAVPGKPRPRRVDVRAAGDVAECAHPPTEPGREGDEALGEVVEGGLGGIDPLEIPRVRPLGQDVEVGPGEGLPVL